MQVSIRDAKGKLSALAAAAQRGEEIIITRRGTPVACLVAIGPRPPEYRVDTVRAVYGSDPDEPDFSMSFCWKIMFPEITCFGPLTGSLI